MVGLGRVNIAIEVSKLPSSLVMPRQGHFVNALHSMAHLRLKHEYMLVLDPISRASICQSHTGHIVFASISTTNIKHPMVFQQNSSKSPARANLLKSHENLQFHPAARCTRDTPGMRPGHESLATNTAKSSRAHMSKS